MLTLRRAEGCEFDPRPGRENQYPNRDCQRGARSLSSLVGWGKGIGLGLMLWL